MHISIWEKESFYAPKDVMIIGSGFVGLWSAYYLKKKHPKLSVTIVDRGNIPTGASTRNAGFACFGSLTELQQDLEEMGESKMLELVSMRYKGLRKIRKLIAAKDIDFDLCGGYELIGTRQNMSRAHLQQDVENINRLLSDTIGEKTIFRISDKKIRAFGFSQVSHLLENKQEGYLHSGKLCQQLLAIVQKMGVTVLTGVLVKGLQQTGGHLSIETDIGMSLKAKHVLVCTNAFARELISSLDVEPARGQILLTSPIEGLPFKGSFHYDQGYYYFRNLGNRVLLGGARNKAREEEATTEMELSGIIQQELELFLSVTILPGKTYEITDRWSGIMGMGSEKLPIIKEVMPNVFCAVRMNGMGVALAPVAAERVVKMMDL